MTQGENGQGSQVEDFQTDYEQATIDTTGEAWKTKEARVLQECESIIALRGAGTNNGIDRTTALALIEQKLIPELEKRLEKGKVAVLFDGDGDDLTKPDIGFVMARLREKYDGDSRVEFLAAQKKGWYYPQKEGGNLATANGKEYETVVFPDNTFPGDHNSFTQSAELAGSEKYEQWYIGASGPIASEQLEDLNKKVKEGTRNVLMVPAPINEDLGPSFETKLQTAQAELQTAQTSGNEEEVKKAQAKVDKLSGVLQQRQRKYGVHYTDSGELALDTSQFEHLSFKVL